jgi:hypothetical protein
MMVIFWDGIIVYSLMMIVQCIWLVVSNPGYINEYSLTEFDEWSATTLQTIYLVSNITFASF